MGATFLHLEHCPQRRLDAPLRTLGREWFVVETWPRVARLVFRTRTVFPRSPHAKSTALSRLRFWQTTTFRARLSWMFLENLGTLLLALGAELSKNLNAATRTAEAENDDACSQNIAARAGSAARGRHASTSWSRMSTRAPLGSASRAVTDCHVRAESARPRL